MMLVRLAELAAALRERRGGQVVGPTPTSWRAVELDARDKDDHVVVLTAMPHEPAPDGWDDFVRSTLVE